MKADCQNKEDDQKLAILERIFWESSRAYQRRTDAEEKLRKYHADYRFLWITCSRAEQLALPQLAREGFVNSKNPELPGLLERGLIIRGPEVKLANESLRRFVLFGLGPEEFRSFEQVEPESQWSKLKAPFQTVLLAVACLLFLTQQELFSFAVKMMGVFVTSVPTLFNFFNLFGRAHPKHDDAN